jgi:hypothetical protein
MPTGMRCPTTANADSGESATVPLVDQDAPPGNRGPMTTERRGVTKGPPPDQRPTSARPELDVVNPAALAGGSMAST